MLRKQVTYDRLERNIYVIKYHDFVPALNILNAIYPLPPPVQIQLDMLHEITAVLLMINSHKIVSVPVNVFNL